MRVAVALLLLCCVAVDLSTVNAATTKLQLLGQAAIPPNAGRGAGTEQVAFDDKDKVAYLIGGDSLYVVDVSPAALLDNGSPAATPKSLQLLKTVKLPTTVNDLSFCSAHHGGYLAVSANGANKTLPGSVTIFNRYLRQGDGSLDQLAQFTVGALPDQLEFSKDCTTILVSNEGEPETYTPASLANDPEGSVSVINLYYCDQDKSDYDDDKSDNYGYDKRSDDGYDEAGTAAAADADEDDSEMEAEMMKKGYKHGSKYRRSQPKNRYGDAPYKKPRSSGPKKPSYPKKNTAPNCNGAKILGNVRTAGFAAWNNKKAQLEAQGVKITGVNATVAQDLEPEYTTFSEDEKTAFVSLQENNAMAVVDVEKAVITGIYALGFKNHSAPANPLDPSNQDGPASLIRNWQVFGMYQPDEIKSYRYNGEDFVVTANEGDSRSDWPGLIEVSPGHAIMNKVNLTVFPGANLTGGLLADNAKLGALQMLAIGSPSGNPYPPYSDPAGTGFFQKLFAFGARSFSIWKLTRPVNGQLVGSTLTQVFDSAAQLEQISQAQLIDIWNSELGNAGNSSWDRRSRNKGPEPEGVAVGPCELLRSYYKSDYPAEPERLCLFLGTERLGVVYVYDITNPYSPVFQSVARPPVDPSTKLSLSAPEGLAYARYSLSRHDTFPVVMVAYEASENNATLPAGLGVYKVTQA